MTFSLLLSKLPCLSLSLIKVICRELPRLGGVISCLPACLVSVVRHPFDFYITTSSPRQEKLFIWPPFFQYNKRLLRQKTGGACLYMPQDDHWQASFEVTPPKKSLFFRGQKNESSPLKSAVSDPKFWRFLFFRRKFCHAVLDSRDDQGLPPD